MSTFTFRYKGLRELKTLLRKLPDSTSKSVIRRSLKKAAEPIAVRARSLAPRDTGLIAESIVIGKKLSRRQKRRHRKLGPDDIEMFVGVSGEGEVAHYAHIVEFGSEKTAPQPFLTPAFEQTKKKAFKVLIDETWTNLEKSINRLKKKGKWVG